MSALTKTFVVLLVVVSLLSAAGFIVFVNQVQNFRTMVNSANANLSQSKADLAAAKAQASALAVQVTAAQKETEAALADNAKLANDNATKVAALEAQVATDKSQAAIAAVTADNLTQALTASEGQRKALNDALTASRTELDTVSKREIDDGIAISDLTAKLDVSTRKGTDLSEQLAQSKADNERLSGLAKEAGLNPNDKIDFTRRSAPQINGIVRDTRPINGIPYATISVGSAENVTKGMTFHVVDRTHTKFLGDLVIDSVDLHEATGRLEGPGIADVRAGADVRTQL